MPGAASLAFPTSLLTPRRLALGLGMLGLVATWAGPWHWLADLEGIAVDERFVLRHRLRPAPKPAPSPVIVGIADSSFSLSERAPTLLATNPGLARLEPAWPWDRSVFGDAVRRLRAAGARLIVFDIVFAGSNPGDAAFAAALAEPGAPVVLASLWQVGHSLAGEGTAVLLEPSPTLRDAAGGHGFANVWPDADGVLRQTEPSLDAATLLGLPADPAGRVPSLAFAAARMLDPTLPDSAGGYIDFHHTAADIPLVPIEDLFLADRWHGEWLKSGAFFRDRAVWIGPTSEIRFKDMHLTPLGPMPGIQAQSEAFATFFERRQPHTVPPWAHPALVVGFILAAAGLTLRPRRAVLQVALALTGLAVWLVTAVAAFVAGHLILPLVAPAAGWIGGAALGIGAQLVSEQRERRRLRAMLGRYVSEEVAARIADRPDAFTVSLRGERRAVTVLFADLRGFTAWVEDAEPEVFVDQLNQYFTAIVDCVLEHGGTLQKYIGDAVLAVWGDTRTEGPSEDTARAVAAALAMLAALERLNRQWSATPGLPALQIAIGVHHGTVMLGNVGHPRRMEFTVMGDAVNTASRLETANRQLNTQVLVSASVAELVADRFRFLPVGPARLKGKRSTVDLFIPVGSAAAPPPAAWTEALTAHDAWIAGDHAAARRVWTSAAAVAGPLTSYCNRRSQLRPATPDRPELDLTALE